jgi:hypothetical protein
LNFIYIYLHEVKNTDEHKKCKNTGVPILKGLGGDLKAPQWYKERYDDKESKPEDND